MRTKEQAMICPACSEGISKETIKCPDCETQLHENELDRICTQASVNDCILSFESDDLHQRAWVFKTEKDRYLLCYGDEQPKALVATRQQLLCIYELFRYLDS